MAVRHAILGILLKRPSYPYELSLNFERLVGFAWQLSRSQVYQTVERLERERLIERVANDPGARGPKWIYGVTEAGGREFERWRATSSTKPRPVRDELLIKTGLATQEDADDLLQAIHLRRLLLAERLRRYSETQPSLYPASDARSWEEVGTALSMGAALAQLNAELAWLDTASAMLDRLGKQKDLEGTGKRPARGGRLASEGR